jgi:hypothetical protein
MCIKCELLDIINKLTKEQNQESPVPMENPIPSPKIKLTQKYWITAS